jgi:DNA replication protein DnaC
MTLPTFCQGQHTSPQTTVLFELICHRYETGSLIITADQPFSQWDNGISRGLYMLKSHYVHPKNVKVSG